MYGLLVVFASWFACVPRGTAETQPPCPQGCIFPRCRSGHLHNEGLPLSGRACSYRCTAPFGAKGLRYCGSGKYYEHRNSLDCRGCAGSRRYILSGLLLPCWDRGVSKEQCCPASGNTTLLRKTWNGVGPPFLSTDVGDQSCWSDLYNPWECCAPGSGWALRHANAAVEALPRDLPRKGALQQFEVWITLLASTRAVATGDAQLRWESEVRLATRTLKCGAALGTVSYFKRNFDEVMSLCKQRTETTGAYGLPPMRSGMFVVDVGAHVGVFTKRVLRLAANAGVERPGVLALEPWPPNFKYLLANTRKSNSVAALNAGLSGWGDDIQMLSLPNISVGANVRGQINVGEESLTYRVPTLSIAEILNVAPGGVIDILKLDCEGCEWNVIASDTFVQLRHRIRYIVAELHCKFLPPAMDFIELASHVDWWQPDPTCTDMQVAELKRAVADLKRTSAMGAGF